LGVEENMARWGMVIDLDRCTGCQACVVACKAENNIPVSSPDGARQGRLMQWMEVIPEVEGEYPNVRARFTPRPCQQCDCRFCVQACPYGVIQFNWRAPHWPGDLREALDPDIAVRPTGVAESCDFCRHRYQRAREQARAEGREVRGEGDYVPACVQACPARALTFGDLDDPNTEAARFARGPRAYRMLEDLGTAPKVFYLKEG
jgi:Fe-S-cluster-containing dehydrogenase component